MKITRRGMTLLELILALALSAILMIAIGMAIDLHLRALDSQRSNVEEAQLSRAVLHRVRDDLRSTMQYEVVDFTVVEQLAAGAVVNQAASLLAGATGENGTGEQGAGGQGLTGGGVPGSGGTGQGNSTQLGNSGGRNAGLVLGTNVPDQLTNRNTNNGNTNSSGTTGAGAQSSGARGSTGLATSGRTASMQSGSRSVMQGTAGVGASGMTVEGAGGQTTGGTENIAENTGPSSIPGLYGNQYELQIDVSRLPRLDEYNGMMDLSTDGSASATRIPSDVKTVAYYLKTQDTLGGGGSMLRGPQTGLVRRELDRAVTSFAMASGGTGEELSTSEKVLAPEVTSLEFQYFDGQAWTTSWNSDAMGGLPVAIEIVLGIASAKSREQQRRQAGGNVAAYVPAADDLLYRLVVKLPVGKKIEPVATEETTDPAAAQSTTLPGGAPPSGAQGGGT